jgi:hypothetical protein
MQNHYVILCYLCLGCPSARTYEEAKGKVCWIEGGNNAHA